MSLFGPFFPVSLRPRISVNISQWFAMKAVGALMSSNLEPPPLFAFCSLTVDYSWFDSGGGWGGRVGVCSLPFYRECTMSNCFIRPKQKPRQPGLRKSHFCFVEDRRHRMNPKYETFFMNHQRLNASIAVMVFQAPHSKSATGR